MNVSFFELFFLAVVVCAIIYSFVASWTRILYRSKSWGQLSANELKVKQGTATLENRVDLFVRTFFTSFFTYQVYLFALALSGFGYLILRYAVKLSTAS